MAYVIVRNEGPNFFAGIDQQHMVAQFTHFIEYAKKFKTVAKAEAFKAKWVGAGVGMPADAIVGEFFEGQA